MPTPQFQHDYSFDPACGLDLEGMLAITPPAAPEDFADFWQTRYAMALQQDTRLRIRPSDRTIGNHTVSDLRYHSTGGLRIGAWLLQPCKQPVRRGAIVGHGYSGREASDLLTGLDDAAVLFPCFRGISLSRTAGFSPEPHLHVLEGIENRDRYVLGGCVDDLWLAVSALLAIRKDR